MNGLTAILTVLVALAMISSAHGDETFGPIIEYTNGHGTSYALGFGDMDNDGDLDIVAPNNGPVLLNNGDGTFYTNFVHGDVAGRHRRRAGRCG